MIIMRRYNVISFLRVLACALVIRGHYTALFDLPIAISVGPTVGAGPVVLFFVISGFLAFCSYESAGDWRAYYRKRVLRILPPYYIILFLCFLAGTFVPIANSPLGIIDWLRYILFVNMWIPSSDFYTYNNLFGFWTMCAFMFFYLLTPLLVRFMKCFPRVAFLLAMGVGINLIVRFFIVHVLACFPFDSLDAMANLNPLSVLYLYLFGMAAGYGYRNNVQQQVAVLFGTILLLMLIFEKQGYVFWGIAAALICLIPQISFPQKWTDSAGIGLIMRGLGNILYFFDRNSYNYYLLHMLIATMVIFMTRSKGIFAFVLSVTILIAGGEILRRIAGIRIGSKK